MTATNDSSYYCEVAKETSWAVPPAWTLTVSDTSGNFTLTINGTATVSIAFGANAAAVQAALVTIVGSGNAAASGTLSGGMTITFAGAYAALKLTLQAGTLSGGAHTLTGGPVYTVVKMKSVENSTAINLELAEEERNAPDKQYEDSAANGGAWENWTIMLKVRPDQTPLFTAGVGFADTVTGPSDSAYTHTQKPSNPGSTYCVIVYDGQAAWAAVGLVGTDFELSSTAGENGTYDASFKGWSQKVLQVTPPTITLPGNTGYVMLKPTNSGVTAKFDTVATSLVQDWKVTWKREAKPKFTQNGSINPYRVEYGKRSCDVELDLLFDDVTQLTNALAVPQASHALQIIMPGPDLIGVGSAPKLTILLPRFRYTGEPKVDKSGASPKLALKGSTLYDTSNAAQVVLTWINEASSAF